MASEEGQKIPPALLGDIGVAFCRYKLGVLGFIFREKPTLDYGIDGEIELFDGARATGRLIAVQVKCGKSYFESMTDSHIVYRFSENHFQYWSKHSLPVIVVLVDPERELCFWAKVDVDQAIQTGRDYKLSVPKSQMLDGAAVELLTALATPAVADGRFTVASEKNERFSSLATTSFVVKLATAQPWTKPEIEQIVRQVTADVRTKMHFLRQREAAREASSYSIHVEVSTTTTASGEASPIVQAECTHLASSASSSTFWDWRFHWNEHYFQGETNEPAVSADAEKYIARNSGRMLSMMWLLTFADIQIQLYNGWYDRSHSPELGKVLAEWNDLSDPPKECEVLHDHILEALKAMRECKALIDSEDPKRRWPFFEHKGAGHALLQKALKHGQWANGELRRLSNRVSA